MRVAIAAIVVLTWSCASLPPVQSSTRHVIVDTDAGTDDFIALAVLLAQRDITVDAITVANGLAHVAPGAANMLRVLTLAGHADIPVYVGRATPLVGDASFPDEWRKTCEELPGVTLPATERSPQSMPAAKFLAQRLSDAQHPVEVLALGPLTNLAEAFRLRPEAATTVKAIFIMGGALHVKGNLRDGWPEANYAAEFNIFVDPTAASEVFASGAQITAVGLDATNKVPIDARFVADMRAHARTPLGHLVVEILDTIKDWIATGTYYAWDPAAAAVLVEPSIATTESGRVTVDTQGAEVGRTRISAPSSTKFATELDVPALRRILLEAARSGVAQR